MSLNYPYEIKELSEVENSKMLRYFKGFQDGYVRVGPKGYFFTNGFKGDAPKIYNMALRPDDVWVVSLPKSGTTWVQELVWMVANDCDYERAYSTSLMERFPFLEGTMFFINKKGEALQKQLEESGNEEQKALANVMLRSVVDVVEEMPSPRFIKSHLPVSLLPPVLLDTCKVVHVARDPRDVAVSYYYHCKLFLNVNFMEDFKTFWRFFINNQIDHLPYFENLKEWWVKRNHPNLLFLFYEDLLKDLPSAVRKVAAFLGKQMTEEQIARLCDHLSFESFKKNKSVNFEAMTVIGLLRENHSFVRKGNSGGWREQFDEEMQQEAARWIEDNLRGTGLKFSDN